MMYQMAVQQGIGALSLALSGESAATKAAFNSSYAMAQKRYQAAEAKHTAEKNIAAIKQDSILSNTAIKMKQDQAAAMATVSAAVAGVEGGSVDDVKYQTEVNETLAIANISKQEDQSIDQQLAKVFSAQGALLTTEESNISYVGEALNAVGNLVGSMSADEAQYGYEAMGNLFESGDSAANATINARAASGVTGGR